MIRAKLALTPERWERIKQIFEAAVNLPADERLGFASSLCDGDSQLESEVRSLLSADDRAGSFLNIPAAAAVGCASSTFQTSLLEPGTVLAQRFEIVRFINSGGMGDVYEARDAELQEIVALKTIRPVIASNADIIERFKREVRQARGISHPNICRVYDLFSHHHVASGRIWFLTMQLLRGETLLERLRRDGPCGPSEALEFVRQMVAGLAAAHAVGIVHGDFKSGNVMLVRTGENKTQIVITDFGLALNLAVQKQETLGRAPEGTPAYMAPEQWRGEPIGFAADQYALAIVICEMISGKRPQPADDAEAPGGQVHVPRDRHIPLRWQIVVRRCLQMRPADRFADIQQVLAALDPRVRIQRRKRIAAVVTMLVIVCASAFAILASAPDTQLSNLRQLTPSTDLSASPSFSRDGKMIVYESDREEPGNLDIYAQRLPDGNPVRITNDPAEERDPDISPDGKLVVYFSERNGGGVYLASTAGGQEHLLAAGGKNPRFSPDGRNVVYWNGDDDSTIPSGHLSLMSLGSRTPVPLVSNFKDARLPTWSSDGKFILFTGCKSMDQSLPACAEWWVTDTTGVAVHDTGSLKLLRKEQIVPFGSVGRWYGDSLLFSGRNGSMFSIWELRLPLARLEATGKPHRLTPGDPRELISSASLTESGTLALTQLSGAVHIWRINHLTSATPPSLSKLTQDADIDICPSVSRNGRWLVFLRGFQLERRMWIRDMQSRKEWEITAPQLDKYSPIVDDAGTTIAFEAEESGSPSIFVADTNKVAGKLCSACSGPSDWFKGQVIFSGGSPSRIMSAEAKPDSHQQVLVERAGLSLAEGRWSPENQYLLFTASSAENAKQIFAVFNPSAGKDANKQRWIPITQPSEWGDKPRWSTDGKLIYYLSKRDGHICLWAQRFDATRGITSDNPFAVMHFHDSRISPSRVGPRSLNVTVSNDNAYIDLGEANASIWTGILQRSYSQYLDRWWH